MRTDPVFNVGDEVICINPYGYAFTSGKAYTVLDYEPRDSELNNGFTWPAYVNVMDDRGKSVVCHANRFKAVET